MLLPSANPSPSPAPSWAATPPRSLRDRIVETLRYLSDEIEVRRAGGLGEAQAAGYIAGRLRRADFAASVLSFRAGIGERVPLLIAIALGVVAAGLAAWRDSQPVVITAGVVAIAALVLGLIELEGREPLRRLFRGRPSQSVVAVRAATGRLRWRAVVIAPLDGPPRAALSRRAIIVLLLVLLAALAGITARLISADPVWSWWLIACAAALVAIGAWAALRESLNGPLPAIHGAGELASLLLVAEELESLAHVEVWIAALGGSTAGHESVDALLDRYPFHPTDTCFINLHRIAAGQPVFVTREGVLRDRRSDRTLLRLADETDAGDVAIDAEPRRLQERTLARSLMQRGQRAITIASHDDRSPFTSPDAATVERCIRLVAGMVRRLDSEGRG
jgi:hypothetical protein